MNIPKQEKGFTIIEVVLVLAIAALIFLMIFVALPALQRGQRDTARKNDQNTVASAINTFRGNNRGKTPTKAEFNQGGETPAGFRSDYIKELNQYDLAKVTAVDAEPTGDSFTVDTIQVVLGEDCNNKSSTRAAAVYVRLEASNAIVCADA